MRDLINKNKDAGCGYPNFKTVRKGTYQGEPFILFISEVLTDAAISQMFSCNGQLIQSCEVTIAGYACRIEGGPDIANLVSTEIFDICNDALPGGVVELFASCDDGNPNTMNDTYDAECNCLGQIDCTSVLGEDFGSITICESELADYNGPTGDPNGDGDSGWLLENYNWQEGQNQITVPNSNGCQVTQSINLIVNNIGEACDDGNPNTVNDVFDADCKCVGFDCSNVEDEVFDGITLCELELDDYAGPSGDLNGDGDEGWLIDNYSWQEGLNQTSAINSMGCRVNQSITINVNLIGGACDDGNPDTQNDVYDAMCNCLGEEICGHPDLEMMNQFYINFGGEDWLNNAGWKDGQTQINCDPCTWAGVGCNSDNRVSSIILPSNNISGIISGMLPTTEHVEVIMLPDNGITGSLTPAVGEITNLKFLDLGSNSIDGEIPLEINQLQELQELRLNNNGIVGKIPSTIGGLDNLEVLNLGTNQLEGAIPLGIYAMDNLRELIINNNILEGSFNSTLNGWPKIELINVNDNLLNGDLPLSLNSYSGLKGLQVANNDFNACYSDFVPLCDLGPGSLNSKIGYFMSGNSLMAWNGDFRRYCEGEDIEGAPCMIDGMPGTINEECECVLTTAVNETYSQEGFSIYPNPTTGMLNIESHSDHLWKIFDVTGQKVFETNSRRVDVSFLEAGVYIISNGAVSKKLLKLD